jgi:hypothetical protein
VLSATHSNGYQHLQSSDMHPGRVWVPTCHDDHLCMSNLSLVPAGATAVGASHAALSAHHAVASCGSSHQHTLTNKACRNKK